MIADSSTSLMQRPRTYRTIARRAALRHDIDLARAKPPRDLSWKHALILLLINLVVVTLLMRWDGFYSWLW